MHAQLIFPHQLFEEHLDAPDSRCYILVEDDLFFRQYRFHVQKLLLHRKSMRAFERRLRESGREVEYVETDSATSSQAALAEVLTRIGATSCTYYDVVDDWLAQRLTGTLRQLSIETTVEDSPSFICTNADLDQYFSSNGWRMQNFYEWQRKRLGILLDDDGGPAGGQWSFDTENRKKLPKKLMVPALPTFSRETDEDAASTRSWVREEFPDNPGDADGFNWPVTHHAAAEALEVFLAERFELFGPYEDAIAETHSFLFHSALSSSLNTGLLSPADVVEIALDYARRHGTPIASVEGFVRQIIGWREYMRASYVLHGRRMRTSNHLGMSRHLDQSWYEASTGIEPVDTVIRRILDTGYAHHIERLMVLGNAAILLRLDPDDVYEWFMAMFIDAYDWVMVPNVYAMSQFAAGNAITTKPYISGSNYLRKMSDLPQGDWQHVWDALYWQFVADHRELLARNPRSSMSVRLLDRMDAGRRKELAAEAERWLA
ncbi:deoxyribodipyrimidine photolyase [Arthrobacter sp. Soil782]|uniref:cryptochrome/photolyase family protein n=1 Tax=Arthrobacter sp. Soil782 TaxID=1736410 RepID=UPI0006F46786|nr:cryptochrome/photolyase family protein [Arthrobacter sp. Soil782]KRF08932.1 deoxyribodipyrimidine photolyase [Arthrobacter sp. Soil782]